MDTKRQNFNITPEQEAEIAWLRDTIDAPTTKDAILRAVRLMSTLAREAMRGRAVYIEDPGGARERLLIPDLERRGAEWAYLVARPHPWRRQLYVKGRRLMASTVWSEMLTNGMSGAEAADDWDLPLEVIDEIVSYCERNRALLKMEADEELQRLAARGVRLEPETAA